MRLRSVLALLLALGTGCGGAAGSDTASDTGVDAGVDAIVPSVQLPVQLPSEPAVEARVVGPPRAGERIAIEAGTYRIGTRPGQLGRVPRDEADLVGIEVGDYEIDRLPYPNDPDLPPRTGVTQTEAQSACRERGQRLCSELEWELACTGGETGRAFATGETMDPSCEDDCPSPSGALRLGAPIGEWTANRGNRGLPAAAAVFRGAALGGELEKHRCGARRAADPLTRSPNLGFRCCSSDGDGSAAPAYPTEREAPRFRPQTAPEQAEVAAILTSVPELAALAGDLRLFDVEAMGRVVADPAMLRGWELAGPLLEWSPTYGERLLILTGRSGESAFLAVVHPMPDGSYLHVGSVVLEGEPGPIAVAFTPPSTDEVLWSAKWGESAEGGAIVWHDEQGRAEIVTR